MEWLPGCLSIQKPDDWRSLPRKETTTHPLTRVAVHIKELESGATPDSRRASITSSSPATGRTNSRPTSVRKGSTSWSGLDPLSAALLSQQREEEDDGDCDDEQDRPGKGSSYHRRRTTLVSQHGDRRPSKAQVAGGSSSLLLHNSDEEWNSFRSHVMSRYTTLQKLSIKSSFLSITSSDRIVVSSGSPVAVVAGAGSSSISDQVKNRLSQLDDVNEGLREERGLTAKEFSDRIEGLKKSLLQSWSTDQRVKALKIVIQSAKMLADVSVPSFYPSLFCLITGEILDHFGSLVHNRIEERWRSGSHELAVETCRNWIYKISSIREIIPRFYVEAAILRTHAILFPTDREDERRTRISASLTRLMHTIRGIADPLVASYARTFLCRVAVRLPDPGHGPFFRDSFAEIFVARRQFASDTVNRLLIAGQDKMVNRFEYLRLFAPSLTWICKCIMLMQGHGDDENEEDCFQQFKQLICTSGLPELNDTALTSIVSTFRADFVVSHFDEIMQLMQLADPSPPDLLIGLGRAFASSASCSLMNAEERTRILRIVWGKVAVLPPPEYLKCASAWIDFVATYFGSKEINSLLSDVLKHTSSPASDSSSDCSDLLAAKQGQEQPTASGGRNRLSQPQSQTPGSAGSSFDFDSHKSLIIRRIVSPASGIIRRRQQNLWQSGERRRRSVQILAMDSLQPLLQTIRDPDVRVSVCKTILQSFFQQDQQADTATATADGAEETANDGAHEEDDQDDDQERDTYLDALHNLSFYCKTLHDSVSLISLEDERRDVAALITHYLRLILFCPFLDREQRFSLLLDARSDYYAMDQVLSFLVFAVNSLTCRQKQQEKSDSSSSGRDFVRSCLAYSFTTIPSIEDPITKLQLYAHSAEMALANAALSQLDSFLKAGMQLLSHLPTRRPADAGDNAAAAAAAGPESSLAASPAAPSYDSFFVSYCDKLLSILLFVPDHPDHEPLYLLKGLANVIAGHEFEDPDMRFMVQLDLMSFLSMASQPQYPPMMQHAGIDSNDVLYGGDEHESFVQDIQSLMQETMQQHLLPHIAQVQVEERKAELCLQLFSRLLLYSDLSRSHKLAVRLWSLMGKYAATTATEPVGRNPVDRRRAFRVRMREAIKTCPDPLLRERITSH